MLRLSVLLQFSFYLVRGGFLFVLVLNLVFSQVQETDTTNQKTTSEAVKRALLFPGGGQFYNGQPIKGFLLLSSALGAGYLYSNNASNYNKYDGENPTDKANFLKLRNKYGWWIGFIYIYGLMDTIVEAHLKPFNDVMSEDLEKPKKEEE